MRPWIVIALAALLAAAHFGVLVLALTVLAPEQECHDEPVISIGACNAYGYCGVRVRSGKAFATYPVVGEMVSVCRDKE